MRVRDLHTLLNVALVITLILVIGVAIHNLSSRSGDDDLLSEIRSHQSKDCYFDLTMTAYEFRKIGNSNDVISKLEKCKEFMNTPLFVRGDLVNIRSNHNCNGVVEFSQYELKTDTAGYAVREDCGHGLDIIQVIETESNLSHRSSQ